MSKQKRLDKKEVSEELVRKRKRDFGEDNGCNSRTDDRKKEGACGQESEEDCGLCQQNIDFKSMPIRTERGKNVMRMHQCRATCEKTGVRCKRHVWEGDEDGWTYNAYEQPLWCKQHLGMCSGVKGRGIGHMGWYKKICDADGLKQPELKFMDEWIEKPENKGYGGYETIKNARSDLNRLKELAERIENQFWYQFYRTKRVPSGNDIQKAYQDKDFLDFITKYFVFLKECKRRREVNNQVCFTQAHDKSHDSYLHAISAMVEAMENFMPEVKNNLDHVKKQIIERNDTGARELLLNEPKVIFNNKPRIIRFDCSDWNNRSVYIKYNTIEELQQLSNVAPYLYEQVYTQIEYKRIKFELPPMKTDKTIVENVSEFAYGASMNFFQNSIHHVLKYGTIMKKDTNQLFVLGILLFMDFWNIGIIDNDAATIANYLIHSPNPSNSIKFLFLSKQNGSNHFYIRIYMPKIINEMIDIRITNIINDYQNRIQQNKNVDESKTKIQNFTEIQKKINDYFTTHDQEKYKIEIWQCLLKLKPEKDVESNKPVIYNLFKEINTQIK